MDRDHAEQPDGNAGEHEHLASVLLNLEAPDLRAVAQRLETPSRHGHSR